MATKQARYEAALVEAKYAEGRFLFQDAIDALHKAARYTNDREERLHLSARINRLETRQREHRSAFFLSYVENASKAADRNDWSEALKQWRLAKDALTDKAPSDVRRMVREGLRQAQLQANRPKPTKARPGKARQTRPKPAEAHQAGSETPEAPDAGESILGALRGHPEIVQSVRESGIDRKIWRTAFEAACVASRNSIGDSRTGVTADGRCFPIDDWKDLEHDWQSTLPKRKKRTDRPAWIVHPNGFVYRIDEKHRIV